MSDSQYIDRRSATRSYRPGGHMSAGLIRAREPYRVKNMLTGLAIGSFIAGVWLYSMSAVKQDNFDDVDEEARAMARAGMKTVEDRGSEKNADTTSPAPVAAPTSGKEVRAQQGLLTQLDRRFPRLLDPNGKTLVWGAPPVDDIGRLSEGGKGIYEHEWRRE